MDMDQEQLGLLNAILKLQIPDKTVWAYGSRVTWKAGETSDLDLAVFGCDAMEIYDLREALEESDLLISVDVMDWESIPNDFKENIRRKYVVLQEKSKLKGWREVKLGEAVNFQRGHDLPKSKMETGDIPVAGSNGIIGYHNTPTTRAPGITIGRSGNIGTPKLYKTDFWAHNTTLYAKDFFGNDEEFIFYLLQTLDLSGFNSGSAVPTLNRNYIHELTIKLPQLPEQKAIAEVLSSLDDKIDLLHRQNKTLEAMAQALFTEWFVHGRDDTWETGKLGDVFTAKGGTTPSTKEKNYWNGDINWTTPRDLSGHNAIFLLDTEKRITEQGLAKISSGLLPVGTVLLSSRAPVGYLAITDIDLAINQGYIAIVCDKILSNYFVYLWCKHNIEVIKNSSGGTVFQEISKSVFREIDMAIPPKKLLSSFDQLVEPIFQRAKHNQYQVQNLENLREILLPKLMSGEVRLRVGHRL